MVEVRKEKERLAEKSVLKNTRSHLLKNANGLAISVSVSDQNDAFEKSEWLGLIGKQI